MGLPLVSALDNELCAFQMKNLHKIIKPKNIGMSYAHPNIFGLNIVRFFLGVP